MRMQGVIPAAGAGKRVSDLPYTKLLPKSMLPVVDRPIIHHIVDTMISLNIEEIFIIVDSMKSPIVKYFGDGNEFNVDIKYMVQEKPTGIADAILLTESSITQDFIVILGDSLILAKNLYEFPASLDSATVVEAVIKEKNMESIRRACCVEFDKSGRMIKIEEKPVNPTTSFRGCGLYKFSKDIFRAIKLTPITPPRNEREITNTINLLAMEGAARAFLLDGREININVIDDLILASELWLDKLKKKR